LTDFLVTPPDGGPLDAARPWHDERLERTVKVVSRKHDLIPVTITDPLEQRLPKMGVVNLMDFETGELFAFDSGGPEGEAYARYMARAGAARRKLFRRLKIDAMELSTDAPYVSTLVEFFRLRQLRLRH
jgi:uncharacterized protein (DUF58 family)